MRSALRQYASIFSGVFSMSRAVRQLAQVREESVFEPDLLVKVSGMKKRR
jgi:hypothetical protein